MSPYELLPYGLAPMPILYFMLVGLLLWKRPVFQRTFFATITAMFLVLCMPIVTLSLNIPLIKLSDPLDGVEPGSVVAVIALTSGVWKIGENNWWPGAESIYRVSMADELRKKLGVPLVIAGGGTGTEKPPESLVVASRMSLQGEGIILEQTSQNTFESAQNLRPIINELGDGPVLVITSQAHGLRTAAVFRHFGIDAKIATAGNPRFRSNQLTFHGWRDFLPSTAGLAWFNSALREYSAIVWYLILGRINLSDLFEDMGQKTNEIPNWKLGVTKTGRHQE